MEAFILVEGHAICLHPLVYKGFIEDFQMVVHVHLSLEMGSLTYILDESLVSNYRESYIRTNSRYACWTLCINHWNCQRVCANRYNPMKMKSCELSK